MIVSLVAVKVAIAFLGIEFDLRLTYIALISAAPVALFSRERFAMIRKIDWATLVFFAAMFVLMGSVWNSGFFQAHMTGFDLSSIAVILLVSVLLSQLISNVPFVALYLPLLMFAGAGETNMVALAAGSTIAGNLMILGAASNVIIIQNAEKKGETLKFLEFAKVGVPLTILNIAVYWIFLTVL